MITKITDTQQSPTLIKMGRGTYMVMIKQTGQTLAPLAGSNTFTISQTSQAATKYLSPQQWLPAKASVNKE